MRIRKGAIGDGQQWRLGRRGERRGTYPCEFQGEEMKINKHFTKRKRKTNRELLKYHLYIRMIIHISISNTV